MTTQNGLVFTSTSKLQGYPNQITALPEEMPANLEAMLSADAAFEYKRENRVFEDKSVAIWDKKRTRLYEYYLINTREKLDARFYRIYSAIGSTMGVTVVTGQSLPQPVIIGRSPSLIPMHLRVWQGKQSRFAGENMEIIKTVDGQKGIDRAITRLQSRRKRLAESPAADVSTKRRKSGRESVRREPWKLPQEADIYENGDEGQFIHSDDEGETPDPARDLLSTAVTATSAPQLKQTVRYFVSDDEEESDTNDNSLADWNAHRGSGVGSHRRSESYRQSRAPSARQSSYGRKSLPGGRASLIVKFKLPRTRPAMIQQPTPDEENYTATTDSGAETTAEAPSQPHEESVLRGRSAEAQIHQAENIPDNEDDTASIIEIEAPPPAPPAVKEEDISSPAKPSLTPDDLLSKPIIVVFRNEAGEAVRPRPWAKCSTVDNLFMQAVVGGLFRSSKESAALVAAIEGYDDAIPIMKGDDDDFDALVEAIGRAVAVKQEGTGEALVIEVRSL